jgi:hypothetical protein
VYGLHIYILGALIIAPRSRVFFRVYHTFLWWTSILLQNTSM